MANYYTYPHVNFTTKTTARRVPEVLDSTATKLLAPFTCDRGPENQLVAIDSYADFVATFGQLNYSNPDQRQILNIGSWLANGGRVMACRLTDGDETRKARGDIYLKLVDGTYTEIAEDNITNELGYDYKISIVSKYSGSYYNEITVDFIRTSAGYFKINVSKNGIVLESISSRSIDRFEEVPDVSQYISEINVYTNKSSNTATYNEVSSSSVLEDKSSYYVRVDDNYIINTSDINNDTTEYYIKDQNNNYVKTIAKYVKYYQENINYIIVDSPNNADFSTYFVPDGNGGYQQVDAGNDEFDNSETYYIQVKQYVEVNDITVNTTVTGLFIQNTDGTYTIINTDGQKAQTAATYYIKNGYKEVTTGNRYMLYTEAVAAGFTQSLTPKYYEISHLNTIDKLDDTEKSKFTSSFSIELAGGTDVNDGFISALHPTPTNDDPNHKGPYTNLYYYLKLILKQPLETPVDCIIDCGYSMSMKKELLNLCCVGEKVSTRASDGSDIQVTEKRDDIFLFLSKYIILGNGKRKDQSSLQYIETLDDIVKASDEYFNASIIDYYGKVQDIYSEDSGEVYVPATYLYANLIPYNDAVYGTHKPTAGLTRGVVTKLFVNQWVNEVPSNVEKQEHWNAHLNYIEKDSRGMYIMSDLTCNKNNNILDRMYAARTLIKMKKELTLIGRRVLHEYNDSIVQARLRSECDAYLSTWLQNGALSTAYVELIDYTKRPSLSDTELVVAINIKFKNTIDVIPFEITL